MLILETKNTWIEPVGGGVKFTSKREGLLNFLIFLRLGGMSWTKAWIRCRFGSTDGQLHYCYGYSCQSDPKTTRKAGSFFKKEIRSPQKHPQRIQVDETKFFPSKSSLLIECHLDLKQKTPGIWWNKLFHINTRRIHGTGIIYLHFTLKINQM